MIMNGSMKKRYEESLKSTPESKADKIYPIDYFCAKNYITGNIQQTPNTYCIHHYAASWKPWYAKIEMTICHLLKIKYRDFLFRLFSKL